MFIFSKRGMKGVRKSESFEVEVGRNRRRKKEIAQLSMKLRGFSKRRHWELQNMKEGLSLKPNSTRHENVKLCCVVLSLPLATITTVLSITSFAKS